MPRGRKSPAHRVRRKANRKRRAPGQTWLPQQLRAWRKRHKLSQSMAAVELGMSRRTLQEWEQGRAMPRSLAFTAIRRAISRPG